MTAQISNGQVTFRVVDAMRGPHAGWIVRLRLQEGKAPALAAFPGSRWIVEGSDGVRRTLEVLGFPVTGGKPSDARIQGTGRVDLHMAVVEGPDSGEILLRSVVRPA
jgi:hypothetical protein